MLEQYTIADIKQLKALGHTSRVKILSALTERAMTAKQLANHFGEEPAKTSYHVKQLLKVGLVELVYTRETQNGIVEKYYRAIARDFQTDPYLARQPEGRGTLEAGFLRALNHAQAGFLHAYRAEQERGAGSSALSYGIEAVSLCPATLPSFKAELMALVQRYAAPAASDGQSRYVFHYLLFPRGAGRGPAGETEH